LKLRAQPWGSHLFYFNRTRVGCLVHYIAGKSSSNENMAAEIPRLFFRRIVGVCV